MTVPSARSTIAKKIKRFIIRLYKWSCVTFTELLSAVVKIPWHYHHFPWLSRPGKWSSEIPRLSMTRGHPGKKNWPNEATVTATIGIWFNCSRTALRPFDNLQWKTDTFIFTATVNQKLVCSQVTVESKLNGTRIIIVNTAFKNREMFIQSARTGDDIFRIGSSL